MTLEELRSRLIEACRGKEEFVRPLEDIAEKGMRLSKKEYTSVIDDYSGVTLITELIRCSGVSYSKCPFDTEGLDCDLQLDISIAKSYEDLFDWYSETLDLAIASCKGEEVKVEVEEEAPSRPLFIVAKVDDLIGLESEDGRFEVIKHRAYQTGFEVIGVRSSFQYYGFENLNSESKQILGELGFRFTIQERKNFLELLKECKEVGFERGESNWYVYSRYDGNGCVVEVGHATVVYTPGIRYISGEDADRIVKECVENA